MQEQKEKIIAGLATQIIIEKAKAKVYRQRILNTSHSLKASVCDELVVELKKQIKIVRESKQISYENES